MENVKVNRLLLINVLLSLLIFIISIFLADYINIMYRTTLIVIFLTFLYILIPEIYLIFFNPKSKILFYVHFGVLYVWLFYLFSLLFLLFIIPESIEIYYITSDKYKNKNNVKHIEVYNAINIAKSEIKKQYNINDIEIKSSKLEYDDWLIDTKFSINNESKNYRVIINGINGNIGSIKDYNHLNINNAKTLIYSALVITIISFIVYIMDFINNFIPFFVKASNFFEFLIPIMYLLLLFIYFYMILRIFKIGLYTHNGKYKLAYKKNSIVFGVIILIFGLIITGVRGIFVLLFGGTITSTSTILSTYITVIAGIIVLFSRTYLHNIIN